MKDVVIEVGKTYKNKDSTVTVLDYVKATRVLVRHDDEFGHEMWTQAYRIRNGDIKNPYGIHLNGVSFTGYGYCNSLDENLRRKVYSLWSCIVGRTLREGYVDKYNTYSDVTLCEQWHNFQVFCKWVNENEYFHSKFQLDKDLLIRGNREYSPDACCFLPQELNVVINVNYNTGNGLPVGVNVKGDIYYEAALSYKGSRKLLGQFNTIQEASDVYVEAKEAYVKELAHKWKDKIEPRAYEALMNWTVY